MTDDDRREVKLAARYEASCAYWILFLFLLIGGGLVAWKLGDFELRIRALEKQVKEQKAKP